MTDPNVPSSAPEERSTKRQIWIGYIVVGVLFVLLLLAWTRGRSRGPADAPAVVADGSRSVFDQCLQQLEIKAYQEALALCQRAAEQDPDNLSAQHNLGYAYRWTGQYSAAEVAFKRVLEADPLNSRALYELASTYMDAGRTDEARAKFEEVLFVEPDHGWARRRLAQLEP